MKRNNRTNKPHRRVGNVANPVGLFIQYLKERNWTQVSATELRGPRNTLFAGDRITIEYVPNVSAMYQTEDGTSHVIRYDECPLPQATVKWLEKQRASRRSRSRSQKNRAMENALKGVLK